MVAQKRNRLHSITHCTGAYLIIIPADDTHSQRTGVYLTSNLLLFICFYCRPSVTPHIKLRGDKGTANPEGLLFLLMNAEENKHAARIACHVFTTREPRAKHVQPPAASDWSVMALKKRELAHGECEEVPERKLLCKR
jgi:hypothetical protein